MNYWLVKTEPGNYAWETLVKDRQTCWDGVRNYQARNFMKEMKAGDQILVYHSGDDKRVMGKAEVVREFYPDPTIQDDRWVAVDIKALEPLKNHVTLVQIKADEKLKDILLVRNSRLSVMPLDKEAYSLIIEKSK